MKIAGLEISEELEKCVESLISSALEFEELIQRPVGITGDVGEVKTCKLLKLKIAPHQTKGFDAIDENDSRYQIKTRRKGEEKKKKGKLPSIKNNEYDFAILTILKNNYDVDEIYKISKRELESNIPANKKRQINISKFKKISEKIYP